MNKLSVTSLLGIASALSGDFSEKILKGPRPHTNLWRLHTTQKINQMETGLWIIGIFCLLSIGMLLANFLKNVVFSRKKTQYRVKTDIVKCDKETNLNKTYI